MTKPPKKFENFSIFHEQIFSYQTLLIFRKSSNTKMGCCQTNFETGEIVISTFKDRTVENSYRCDDGFAEISLDSKSDETELNQRYTEQSKTKDFVVTFRSTSYSLHKTELEQSFLQSKGNIVNKF